MITKIRVLGFARKQSERFMALFHRDREPLNIFETGLEFEGSPLYEIYEAGCEELCFQVLGSTEVDETFKSRLRVRRPHRPGADALRAGRHGTRCR